MFYLLIPALRDASTWRKKVELQLRNLRSREIVAGLLDGSLGIQLPVPGRAVIGTVKNWVFKERIRHGVRLKPAGSQQREKFSLGWRVRPLATRHRTSESGECRGPALSVPFRLQCIVVFAEDKMIRRLVGTFSPGTSRIKFGVHLVSILWLYRCVP